MKTFYFLLFSIATFVSHAQSNIVSTNPLAKDILVGNFDPADYLSDNQIQDPYAIIEDFVLSTTPNDLKEHLIEMSAFQTRNTGSDTLSINNGIGAARKWAYEKFESFSQENENRLIVSYLQFDREICEVTRHKNIFAVLPGTGPQYDESILIEAHFDSRCRDECDIICDAYGMEDNGSGSALVLELARTLSKYNFNRSIIFLLTIGEEQGLYGADAFSDYVLINDINLKAVFNNDIVGGVICGETASPQGALNLKILTVLMLDCIHLGALTHEIKVWFGLQNFNTMKHSEIC